MLSANCIEPIENAKRINIPTLLFKALNVLYPTDLAGEHCDYAPTLVLRSSDTRTMTTNIYIEDRSRSVLLLSRT